MRDDLNRFTGMGLGSGTWIAIAAAVAVLLIAFMWAPWKGSGVATNDGPNTTVGSSTRPAPPAAPTAPAPTAPTK